MVTTTDYLASHSEERILAEDAANNQIELTEALTHQHNASVYPIPATVPGGVGPVNDPLVPDVKRAVDTRAAVALLSRNIKIVSEGGLLNRIQRFDISLRPPAISMAATRLCGRASPATRCKEWSSIGLVRAGLSGVIRCTSIWHGGRRSRPTRPMGRSNYLKDSSIHESMTRWVTIHATQGMYVARNVGFMSIGHGFSSRMPPRSTTSSTPTSASPRWRRLKTRRTRGRSRASWRTRPPIALALLSTPCRTAPTSTIPPFSGS